MTVYLDLETVLAINLEHGGPGAGVRDREGVEGAINRARATGFGQDLFQDVWTKAAAYLHGLCSTQYFHDGNKRTAWLVATTFLILNGKRLPHVDDVEAEAFVLTVAKDLFSNEDEPDRTIEQSAEWFRVKWDNQRVGPATDPRLEFVFAALSWHHEEGNFSLDHAGLYALTPLEPFPTAQLAFGVFMRIHWRSEDLGREHEITAVLTPDDDHSPRVNRNRVSGTVGLPVPSGHPHHTHGVMPILLGLEFKAVFLGPGHYRIDLFIDGASAASLPMKVTDPYVEAPAFYDATSKV
ncbi:MULTISPECIES: Fic family protein [unclassified Rhodococcus (in: high G+C Gram-positive bacteria)]|uniref:type II toxin-antitoxin system death-on-curing family toxin n=1 Tax=unclassified Rhodococcus (in: high G+C Gram-positive bacteria) TaxID=192944 RepID=UPI00339137B1